VFLLDIWPCVKKNSPPRVGGAELERTLKEIVHCVFVENQNWNRTMLSCQTPNLSKNLMCCCDFRPVSKKFALDPSSSILLTSSLCTYWMLICKRVAQFSQSKLEKKWHILDVFQIPQQRDIICLWVVVVVIVCILSSVFCGSHDVLKCTHGKLLNLQAEGAILLLFWHIGLSEAPAEPFKQCTFSDHLEYF